MMTETYRRLQEECSMGAVAEQQGMVSCKMGNEQLWLAEQNIFFLLQLGTRKDEIYTLQEADQKWEQSFPEKTRAISADTCRQHGQDEQQVSL